MLAAIFHERRSSTKQVFSLRVRCEKYHQCQQENYLVLNDFRKAFDQKEQTERGTTALCFV